MNTPHEERHVLGLSGGRDSAALAVYMRQNYPELAIDYFFTDTGKELPEVYEFLVKLEGFLGQPILRLNPDRDFDFWLRQYNNFLPSATEPVVHTAAQNCVPSSSGFVLCSTTALWFTATSLFAPMRNTGKATPPSTRNLIVRLPLKEAGIDKAGVLEILEGFRLGVAPILRMAYSQRLHFLFLPAEDRVGATDGAASGLFRRSQEL